MNKLLENKWAKLAISCLSLLYIIFLLVITVNSFLYRIEITNPVGFVILYGLVNLLFVFGMYLTRKTLITSISSFCMMLFCFFILIFDFGNLYTFIPAFLVSIFMFFACKGKETTKTVVGTIYLLIYVLGIVAYILAGSFFGSKIQGTTLTSSIPKDSSVLSLYTQDRIDKVIKDNVSPDGKYSFFLVDIDNKLTGELQLVAQPTHLNKKHVFYNLRDTGRTKVVGYIKSRGDAALPEVKWVGDNKIQYKFPNQPVKNSVIKDSDVEKDYFSFLYKE